MTRQENPAAVELRGIDKHFGAVHANKNVSLRVERGTVHGIVGENGAGKSTLMSILYGFYQADAGTILVNGREVAIRSPAQAIAHGIGMVHQHFMLVENFTVLENIVLGAEGGAFLGPGLSAARRTLGRLKKEYGLAVPPDDLVSSLPVGLQQRVEILKALYRGAEVLILDEPTGVLTPKEADHLFAVLRKLKDQGKTILFITHKLREIMAVTDDVSVMRKGSLIGTLETHRTTPERLAELMVGRSVDLKIPKRRGRPGAPLLEVRRLSYVDAAGVERLKDISFDVCEGEIVGIAGVSGNGQTELLEVLSGMRAPASGEIFLHGKPLATLSDPRTMRHSAVAHVPEDRQRLGLVMPFVACENTILGYHDSPAYGAHGLIDRYAIRKDAFAKMRAYDVRPCEPLLRAAHFSGGNQQKLVLAREIEHDPDLLIVGQPTRGVDIGAIEFIHRRLVELRDQGKAILLISVELDEIRSLSDRILVMFSGAIVGECAPSAPEAEIGLLMAGVARGRAA
ncbi:MAG TPA: ABC transporter ATP-binding protein [Aestuariivirgaceae bacterium]|jgi:simple sugar transport system ATP-binding protein